MSEDATQMINVTLQGMEFTFKASKEMLEIMVRFAACLKRNAISYGKWQKDFFTERKIKKDRKLLKKTGKLSGRKLKRRDDTGRVSQLKVSEDFYKFLDKNAKKYGLCFSLLPDFVRDGSKHLIFPQTCTEMFAAAQQDYLGVLEKKRQKEEKREAKREAKKEIKEKKREAKKEAKTAAADRNEAVCAPEDAVSYIKGQGMDRLSDEEFLEILGKTGGIKEDAAALMKTEEVKAFFEGRAGGRETVLSGYLSEAANAVSDRRIPAAAEEKISYAAAGKNKAADIRNAVENKTVNKAAVTEGSIKKAPHGAKRRSR